jgi:hypothetical protein
MIGMLLRAGPLVALVLMPVLVACVPVSGGPLRSEGAAVPNRAVPSLGGLPLYFIENRGQVDPQVAYYLQGRDTSVYFTPSGLTFSLPALAEPSIDAAPTARERWALKLDFVGADPAARPFGRGPTSALVSYFKGPQEQWRAGIPTYGQVVYADLWPSTRICGRVST